eukprot:PhM_4_TR11370/c0_g1_i1/m.28985
MESRAAAIGQASTHENVTISHVLSLHPIVSHVKKLTEEDVENSDNYFQHKWKLRLAAWQEKQRQLTSTLEHPIKKELTAVRRELIDDVLPSLNKINQEERTNFEVANNVVRLPKAQNARVFSRCQDLMFPTAQRGYSKTQNEVNNYMSQSLESSLHVASEETLQVVHQTRDTMMRSMHHMQLTKRVKVLEASLHRIAGRLDEMEKKY